MPAPRAPRSTTLRDKHRRIIHLSVSQRRILGMSVPVNRTAASQNRIASCALCAVDISHRGWQAKFCEACKDHRRYHYKLDLVDVPPVSMHTACLGCSTAFNPPRWQPYCSRQCACRNAAAQRFKATLEKQCTGCDKTFTTTNPKQATCSKACMQWIHAHPGIPGILRILDKECMWCLTPFAGKSAARKYCRPDCLVKANQERRNKRTRECYVEQVSKHVVAKRDKWRCQLCRKKVDASLAYPHPMSWSLDHVIPISRGGEHSYANTQLTHLVCNIRKRNKITEPQQLALIG